MSDMRAKNGAIYVCAACGKTSDTRYGISNRNGWDESCMMRAVLCHKNSLRFNEKGELVDALAVGEQLEPGFEEAVPSPGTSGRDGNG